MALRRQLLEEALLKINDQQYRIICIDQHGSRTSFQ
jgi:hypothetical protein